MAPVRGSGTETENTRRIVFHEITKKAILNAIANPRDIDINRVDAQQARRVLDRIVDSSFRPCSGNDSNRRSRRTRAVGGRTPYRRTRERDKALRQRTLLPRARHIPPGVVRAPCAPNSTDACTPTTKPTPFWPPATAQTSP